MQSQPAHLQTQPIYCTFSPHRCQVTLSLKLGSETEINNFSKKWVARDLGDFFGRKKPAAFEVGAYFQAISGPCWLLFVDLNFHHNLSWSQNVVNGPTCHKTSWNSKICSWLVRTTPTLLLICLPFSMGMIIIITAQVSMLAAVEVRGS